MADLLPLLRAAGTGDKNAQHQLEKYEEENFKDFAIALSKEFAGGSDPMVRQIAGLCLKNTLNAKDTSKQQAKHQRWKGMDPGTRSGIKEQVLNLLKSNERAFAHTAAQAAAEIAAIELPYEGEWPAFLPTLIDGCTAQQSPDLLKITCIECLGFTAERLSEIAEFTDVPDLAEGTVNSMLTAIVNGTQPGNSDQIRLAATTGLRNALIFANRNFEKKVERDAIMSAICELTRSKDDNVRMAAYDCLAQIAFLYYNYLQDYMTTLFEMTVSAIRNDDEVVGKSAVEFWNTICDVEQERLDEAAECAEHSLPVPADRVCVRYVEAALGQLVPLLLETLVKQDPEADEDTYNLHMAGSVCLSLMSQTVEDPIVPGVMPFVTQNIQNPDWRFRDAAIMAFQCILDGPSTASIGVPVSQSITPLLQALTDENTMVKDTAAHCISQICKLHVHSIPNEMFPQLLTALTEKVQEQHPKVASQACSAIHNLASAFQEEALMQDQQTNALSVYVGNLVAKLWERAEKPDAQFANLRVASMEAIAVLIQVSAMDQKPMLLQFFPAVIGRMEQTIREQQAQGSGSPEQKESREQLQGLLCALFQVLYQKLEKNEVAQYTDQVMTMLLSILSVPDATCHEEVFSAISAIADLLEEDFVRFMGALAPFLLAGIKSSSSYRLCMVAVAAIGDICRAIEAQIQPYCDAIMGALLEALKDVSINRAVKPPVISCFGDIALAIGGGYEPYLQVSAMMLMQASGTKAPEDDEDLIEYVNVLRQSILEAYTGIVQGLKGGNKLPLFVQFVPAILNFLREIAEDRNRDDGVLKAAVALVGDIAQAMGTEAEIKTHINQPFVAQMLQDAGSSPSDGTREIASWAHSAVQHAVQAN